MKNMLLSLLIVGITTTQVLSVDPTISQYCKGEHEYLDQDGKCRLCEKCPAGNQPTGYCGHGEREMNYECQTCPDGTFSTRNDYNICVICRPCHLWNTEVAEECEPRYDRVCGGCSAGFFRLRKTDGLGVEECQSCDLAPHNTPECREDVEEFPWKVVAIVAIAGSAVLLFVVVLVPCCWWRRRKRKKSVIGDGIPPAETSLIDAGASVNFLSESHARDSRSESDHNTDCDSGHSSQVSIVVPTSAKSVPISHVTERCEAKAAATRNILSLQPRSGITASESGYSDMPTVEYRESLRSDSNGQSCVPTRQFDEVLVGVDPENRVARVCTNSFHPSAMHSARRHNRPQIQQSSSCENLLENVDRDSKDVGERRTPLYEFHADSFDTRSCSSEVTKPHVVGSNG